MMKSGEFSERSTVGKPLRGFDFPFPPQTSDLKKELAQEREVSSMLRKALHLEGQDGGGTDQPHIQPTEHVK